jgi:electron transfer flavoprotein beta subunit
MAEHLGIPHVTWVKSIQRVDEASVVVEQNMEDSLEVVHLPFPCLISVEKDIYQPRLPSYLNFKKTKDRQISLLTLRDLPDQSVNNYGLFGSPTQVERVFQPECNIEQVLWNSNEADSAQQLFDLLVCEKFI